MLSESEILKMIGLGSGSGIRSEISGRTKEKKKTGIKIFLVRILKGGEEGG